MLRKAEVCIWLHAVGCEIKYRSINVMQRNVKEICLNYENEIILYLDRALNSQALSEQSSTHITRHAATSPVFNIGISNEILTVWRLTTHIWVVPHR